MFIYSVRSLFLLIIILASSEELLADYSGIVSQAEVFNTLRLRQPYLLSSDHRSCTGAFCLPQPLTENTDIGLSNSILPDTLSNYLIPQNISLQQQSKMQVELQQLHDKEQQTPETSSEGVTAKRAKMYFAMNSGQARVILFLPEGLSKEQKKDWLNSVVDDLFSVMKPLLRYEQNLEDKEEDGPTEHALIAMTGGGGGDDDPDPNPEPSLQFYFVDPENRYQYSPMPMQLLLEEMLKDKFSVLQNIWQRLHQAIIDGNRDLAFILRDRLMVISADLEELLPMVSASMLPANLASELSGKLVFFHKLHFHELQQLYWKNYLVPGLSGQDKSYGKQSPRGRGGNRSNSKKTGSQRHQGSKSSGHNTNPSKNADDGGGDDYGNTEDNNNGGDGSNNPEDENNEIEKNSLKCFNCEKTLSQNEVKALKGKLPEVIVCDKCMSSSDGDDISVKDSRELEILLRSIIYIEMNREPGSLHVDGSYAPPTRSVPKASCHSTLMETADYPVTYNEPYRAKVLEDRTMYLRLAPGYDPVIESLINEFLDIPEDDFLPLEEPWRSCVFKFIKSYSKGGANQHKEISALGNLFKATIGFLIHKNKEKARLAFDIAIESAKTFNVDISGYVRSWITLWKFKQTLDGNLDHKQELLSFLREPLASWNDDLHGLRILLFCGALPSFREFADFESLMNLIFHESILGLMISPVSFTRFDQLRYGCYKNTITEHVFSENKSSPICCKFFLFYSCLKIMQISELDTGKDIDGKIQISICESAHQSLNIDKKKLSEFVTNMIHIDETELGDEDIDDYDSKAAKRYPRSCELGTLPNTELSNIILHFCQARRLSNKSSNAIKSASIAKHYKSVAEHHPAHWRIVFDWYEKAQMFEAAADAASNMSEFWAHTNPLIAEYWDQKSSKMHERDSNKKKQQSPEKIMEGDFSVDKAMEFIGMPEPAAPPVEIIKKKQNQAKDSLSPVKETSKAEGCYDDKEDEDEDEDEEAQKHSIAIKKAIIPVKHHAANLIDPSQSSGTKWQIKKKTGSIIPQERQLSKNWNRKIKIALHLIQQFRDEGNIEQENEVYRKLLNDNTKKTLIGIERIWEEKAWTSLHEFDDILRTGVIPGLKREYVKKTVTQVKTEYLLPALAMKLGLDQMNLQIEAEVIKNTADDLLKQPEYQDPEIQKELRFRLRCLFSSMGHVYSLLSIATPSKQSALGQIARKWYGFKTIDLEYKRAKSAGNRQ